MQARYAVYVSRDRVTATVRMLTLTLQYVKGCILIRYSLLVLRIVHIKWFTSVELQCQPPSLKDPLYVHIV
jgi:hypothetical protein